MYGFGHPVAEVGPRADSTLQAAGARRDRLPERGPGPRPKGHRWWCLSSYKSQPAARGTDNQNRLLPLKGPLEDSERSHGWPGQDGDWRRGRSGAGPGWAKRSRVLEAEADATAEMEDNDSKRKTAPAGGGGGPSGSHQGGRDGARPWPVQPGPARGAMMAAGRWA